VNDYQAATGRKLSVKAKEALDLIGDVGALCYPFDDSLQATIVRRHSMAQVVNPDWDVPEKLVLDTRTRDEILSTGLLGVLTRKRNRNKTGWEECDGLPMKGFAEFWCFIQ